MEPRKKLVFFDQYCKKCAHKTTYECDEPCNECLTNPVNEDSHKPVNYIEKEKK